SAIKETQRTYRDILNTMSEAIYVQDQNGTFLEVNEGAARMYQCAREDLLGKNPADVSAPGMNDLDMIKRLSAKVWETGKPASFEFWALRCTGDIFLKEVIVNKGRYFGQDVLLATARDITDRKEAERKLRESEELHRVLLMTVPDLIVRTDVEGNVVFVNEVALGAELQLRKDQVIGKNMLSFIAPEDLERAGENTRLMFEAPLGPQEYRLIAPNGESIYCEVNGEVVRDEKHQPLGMVYVIRNITERRNADEKIRTANKMFQLVIDNIPQYVFWKDRDSRFLGCNDNIAHAAGLNSPADLIGKTDYDMPWSKEEADFYVECDRRVMSTGIPEFHIIEPQTRADGQLAWLDTNKVPLVDDQGNVVGILGTFEDITERIKAENELKLEARLRQLLVEISSAYINAPLESIQAEIQSSMRKIAEFVEADRCYIFDADPGKETYSNTYEWSSEGIEPQIEHLQRILIPIEWNQTFESGEAVYIHNV
ncbi:MAG: PAS domain S-box protein, partial [Candidatus Cloacimonadaceae bacterium]|nr:PAS domain S-box protein [Candidatus Cloacimonadaceae bacterium]